VAKRRVEERLKGIKPNALLGITAIEQTELLEEILETLRYTIPEGVIVPSTVSVTDEWTPVVPAKPLFSFYMINDGPNSVYFSINRKVPLETVKVPLKSGEDIAVDMDAPKIRKMYLTCEKGKSATVRLWLKS